MCTDTVEVAKDGLIARTSLIALVLTWPLTACTTSSHGPRPSRSDVVLIASYGAFLGSVSPGTLAKDAGALACQDWVLAPASHGSHPMEMHIRVRASSAAASSAALTRAGVRSVVGVPLAAYSAPPASKDFILYPVSPEPCPFRPDKVAPGPH
jgi:hypothetical protein